MEQSVVAVVMRTKDRIALLGRALESVLGQTYQKWHLIVVNDGGESHSVERLTQNYVAQFKGRLTLVHNPTSLGMEAASNIGINSVSSEYLVIHDDDDTWHPEFLKETVNVLEQDFSNQLVGVISHSSAIYEEYDGEIFTETERVSWNGSMSSVRYDQMLAHNMFPPISFLFRRDCWKQIGGFREDLSVLGDWDFNLKLLSIGDIGLVPRHLANYHLREKAVGSLGNSVIFGKRAHMETQTRITTSHIRKFVAAGEENRGLATLLSTNQEELILKLSATLQTNPKIIEHQLPPKHSLMFDPHGILGRFWLKTRALAFLPINIILVMMAGGVDSAQYVRTYPDVANSRLSPGIHFCLFGIGEGRQFFPKKRTDD